MVKYFCTLNSVVVIINTLFRGGGESEQHEGELWQGRTITPKHPKDDSLDLSSLFVCFLNTHAPMFRLWNYIRTAQPCPKCVYCWACCVFALGCVSEQAAALGDCQTLSDWQQRAAGLRLAKHKQTQRFHLPWVWRATRTHSVTFYGPERMRLGQPLNFWSSDGSGIKETVNRGAVWVLVVIILHETVFWPFELVVFSSVLYW